MSTAIGGGLEGVIVCGNFVEWRNLVAVREIGQVYPSGNGSDSV